MKKKWNIYSIFAYSLVIFLWASSFSGIRVGLESFRPEQLALLRLLIGSVVLLLIACATRIRLPDLKDVPAILLLGFLGFTVYHTALSIGEKTVSSGVASLFVSTTPIFSAFLGVFFLRERFGIAKWTGSIISFVGVIIISVGTGEGDHSTTGILLVLIAAFSESLYFVFQTRYLKKYGFLAFVTYTIWGGTLFMLFFVQGLEREIIHASLESIISVGYLGVFPTVIPYFALAYITSQVGTAEATTSLYLIPTFTFFIAWIWLGEIPTILSIGGGVLTLLGVLVTHINENRFKEKLTRDRKLSV